MMAPAPAAPLSSSKAKEGDNEIASEASACLKSLRTFSTPLALWEKSSLEEGCVSH